MALVVTFCRVAPGAYGPGAPLAVGSSARTERVHIDSVSDGTLESDPGALAAQQSENALSLYAESACWVSIGKDPVASPGNGWSLAAGERLWLWVETGDKVAVSGIESSE